MTVAIIFPDFIEKEHITGGFLIFFIRITVVKFINTFSRFCPFRGSVF
jgi:hypothetical protein